MHTSALCPAKFFFRSGRPFSPALRTVKNVLEEAATIRNGIAHESTNAREKFEKLVRNKLGQLPGKLTVGGFLVMIVPKSSPPVSFLDYYFDRIEYAVNQIIPS